MRCEAEGFGEQHKEGVSGVNCVRKVVAFGENPEERVWVIYGVVHWCLHTE